MEPQDRPRRQTHWTEISSSQAGVITREQLRSTGLTDARIATLVDTRILVRERRRQYVVAGSPRTRDTEFWLALLRTQGIMRGRTAAYVWGMLREPPDEIDVCVPLRSSPRRQPGVRLRRSDLSFREHTTRHGYSLTTRLSTALDVISDLPEADALEFADRAAQQGWITERTVQRRLAFRRKGNRRLKAVIDKLVPGAHSDAERLAHRLMRDARIGGWEPNHPLLDAGMLVAIIDVAFVALRIAVEIDGFAYHRDSDQFQRDRSRQNTLVAGGWMVLRFTWRDLIERPDHFVASIQAAVADRQQKV